MRLKAAFLLSNASVFNTHIRIYSINHLLINAVEIIIYEMVYFLFRKSIFRVGYVVRPFTKCVRVFTVSIRSSVIYPVNPVMKTIIVLHSALAGVKLYFTLDDFNHGVESASI